MGIIKKYGFIIILLLFAGIVASTYFFWWPKYQEFENNRKILETKGLEIENKKGYLSEINAKLKVLSDYEEDMAKINSAIPVYDFSEVVLFGYMQKMASENGMILQSLDFSPPGFEAGAAGTTGGKKVWKMEEVSFSISLLGLYTSLKDFLAVLYLNSRIIEVDSISFSSYTGEEQKKDVYNFDLQLSVKYYVEDKSQASSFPADMKIPEI